MRSVTDVSLARPSIRVPQWEAAGAPAPQAAAATKLQAIKRGQANGIELPEVNNDGDGDMAGSTTAVLDAKSPAIMP